MALRDKDGVDKERRLPYVAMTRAKDELWIHAPLRFHIDRFGHTSRHGHAPLPRFLTPIRSLLDETTLDGGHLAHLGGTRWPPERWWMRPSTRSGPADVYGTFSATVVNKGRGRPEPPGGTS